LNEKLAPVLGFVDVDGRGISGIELGYESYLSGKDGKSILQKDAMGNTLMPVTWSDKNQQNGNDVILTIDHVYQTIAEEELKKVVDKYDAKGGCAIITDPKSGKILAMASLPSFNANRATQYPPETWRIRPITDIFEPGSTFKIVTLTAAVSLGIDKTKRKVFCENGTYRIFGEEINDTKKYGTLSFENVFVKSSNIGAAKIASAIGRNELFKTSRSLGFGNRTGIDLPGEVAGILKRPAEWSDFTLSALSYGHEVAVTPLQIALAYGAIANGGLLMKPLIVEEVRTKDQKILLKSEPQIIRRVMREETARMLTRILQNAVENGTGTSAKIPGVDIAGKTGTAQKPLQNQTGYSNTEFVASFAGFYPAHDPNVLIYVAVDEPNPAHSGGGVSAPAFRNILKRIMEVKNVPKRESNKNPAKENSAPPKSPIPNFINRRLEIAATILKEYGIRPKIYGMGNVVRKQELVEDENTETEIILTLTDYPKKTQYVTVPALSDYSLRQAICELSARGLKAKISGTGRVVKQEPPAGSKIKVGARCYLICEPVSKKAFAGI
jgi:cell division protein FtsI/penicillin-binding protein 2